MTYKTIPNDGMYEVHELDTNSVVYKSTDESKSRAMARSLNLGAGFAGFTPTFFLTSFEQQLKKASTEK